MFLFLLVILAHNVVGRFELNIVEDAQICYPVLIYHQRRQENLTPFSNHKKLNMYDGDQRFPTSGIA